MNPKKAKDLIKPTAEKMGVSEDLVNDLSSFFWSEVRKAIVDMRGHQIFIPGLGTMKVKPWKLEELITKYQAQIAAHNKKLETRDPIKFNQFSIFKQIHINLEKALKVQVMIDKDKVKKQEVKNKRDGEGNQGSIQES